MVGVMDKRLAIAFLLAALAVGCTESSNAGGSGGTGGTQACDDFDPKMRVLWGETHVHTRLSLDSFWFNSLEGTREAYEFAKGGTVGVACEDRNVACEQRQLDRPLDFAAVSDHAEFLGLFDEQCRRDDPAASCGAVESIILDNIELFLQGGNVIDPELIWALFPDAAPTSDAWAQVIADANAANDPCEFTSFPAYEFSPLFNGSTVHRNVLFLGDDLPDDVFAYATTEDHWDLFDHLEAACGNKDGCEYLTIPHNPNLSAGRMFLPVGTEGIFAGRNNEPLTPEDAALRAKNDVVVEMHQLKGQSECMPGFGLDGLGNDEIDAECFFENNKPICTGRPEDGPRCLPPEETVCTRITSDQSEEAVPFSCSAPNDFMRGALAEGLKARKVVGVNPYQFGFVGATDQHNANPGDVEETGYIGAAGVLDNDPAVQLGQWTCELDDPECEGREFTRSIAFSNNPGGLAAVWATENTREAIFEALRARRTYSTSGPRIEVRSYGTFEAIPEDVCDQLTAGEAPVESGALNAVPMGSLLPNGAQGAPSFVVFAAQDAEGAPLERIQVIKGKLTEAGSVETSVVTIAGAADRPNPNADCTVDTTGGAETLCAVWTDPEFKPGEDSYYYARVLQQPTCRWNTDRCVEQGVSCSELDAADGTFPEATGNAGFEGCCDIIGAPGSFAGTNRFDVIRERAWTSPIWYESPSL